MQIRKQVLKKIDSIIKAKIAEAVKKHFITVERWVDNNHPALTQASALKVLREELNLTDDQILEESKSSAV